MHSIDILQKAGTCQNQLFIPFQSTFSPRNSRHLSRFPHFILLPVLWGRFRWVSEWELALSYICLLRAGLTKFAPPLPNRGINTRAGGLACLHPGAGQEALPPKPSSMQAAFRDSATLYLEMTCFVGLNLPQITVHRIVVSSNLTVQSHCWALLLEVVF